MPGRVYVRMQEVDGRLRMTELYIDGRGTPIPPSALRRFPVQMLEQWVASWFDTELGSLSIPRSKMPGPDLSRLAAYFGGSRKALRRNTTNWVVDSFLAQEDGNERMQAPYPKDLVTITDEDDAEGWPVELSLPPDGRLTDEFLHDVAVAYEAAIRQRLPPANELAKAANVSPRTVHRWVYTARKRGVMPPATTRGRIV